MCALPVVELLVWLRLHSSEVLPHCAPGALCSACFDSGGRLNEILCITMGFCRTLATGALTGWPNQINGKSMLFFGTDVVDQLLLGCEAFVLDYGGVGGCLCVATYGVGRALGINVYADDLCGCCAGVVDEPDGVAVGEFGDDFHVVCCLLVDVMLCGCVCGGEPVVAVEA